MGIKPVLGQLLLKLSSGLVQTLGNPLAVSWLNHSIKLFGKETNPIQLWWPQVDRIWMWEDGVVVVVVVMEEEETVVVVVVVAVFLVVNGLPEYG